MTRYSTGTDGDNGNEGWRWNIKVAYTDYLNEYCILREIKTKIGMLIFSSDLKRYFKPFTHLVCSNWRPRRLTTPCGRCPPNSSFNSHRNRVISMNLIHIPAQSFTKTPTRQPFWKTNVRQFPVIEVSHEDCRRVKSDYRAIYTEYGELKREASGMVQFCHLWIYVEGNSDNENSILISNSQIQFYRKNWRKNPFGTKLHLPIPCLILIIMYIFVNEMTEVEFFSYFELFPDA